MTVAMKSVILFFALIVVANAQNAWWQVLQRWYDQSSNPVRCWECHNARTNAACLANGRLRQCDYNQGSCQNTIRVNHGRVRISKTCKQTQACMNNQRQNNQRAWLGLQCNMTPQNIVCRCCCQTDECNDKALYCRGAREQAAMKAYETNQPKQESQQGQQRQTNNNNNRNNANDNTNRNNQNNYVQPKSQNPCHTGTPCGNGATCVVGDGHQYKCKCTDGWTDSHCNTPVKKADVSGRPVRPLDGYIGCFKDGKTSGRDLAPYSKESDSMTVEMCAEYCGNNGSPYFGLQYKVQCWCSAANWDPENPTYGKVEDSECKHACSGDATQLCGATWRQAVYKTADVSGTDESETEESKRDESETEESETDESETEESETDESETEESETDESETEESETDESETEESETDESDESDEAVPPSEGEEAVPPPAEEDKEYTGEYDDWVTSDCKRPSEGECSEEFTCCNKKRGIKDITRTCKGPGECNPNKEHTKQKDCILKCECAADPVDACGDGVDQCFDNVESHECTCIDGWVPNADSTFCDRDEDPCDDTPCFNGATCTADGETFSCDCAPGYHGPLCEEEHIRGETCWVEGEQFAGTTVDTAANGKKCDPWSNDHAGWHYYDDTAEYNNKWYDPFYVDYDESTAGSWCRNYKSDPNGPYCFVGAVEVTDEYVKEEILKGNILTTQDHFEYCDIPKCPPLIEAVPPPSEESDEAAPPPEEESDEAVPPPEEESDEAAPPPEEESDEAAPPPEEESDEAAPPLEEESDEAVPPPEEESNEAAPPSEEESNEAVPPPEEESDEAVPPPED